MQGNKLTILAGAALALGGLAAGRTVFSSASAALPPGEQAGQLELDKHARQLQSLEREIARLRLRQVAPATPQAGTEGSAHEESDEQEEPRAVTGRAARPMTHQELLRAAREQELAHLERLDARFYAEARDPRWNPAPEVRAKLANVLSKGAQLRDVECQATMCRVETVHPRLEAYTEFLAKGFNKPTDPSAVWGGGSANFTITNEPEHDGNVVAVVHLLREGHQFPAD